MADVTASEAFDGGISDNQGEDRDAAQSELVKEYGGLVSKSSPFTSPPESLGTFLNAQEKFDPSSDLRALNDDDPRLSLSLSGVPKPLTGSVKMNRTATFSRFIRNCKTSQDAWGAILWCDQGQLEWSYTLQDIKEVEQQLEDGPHSITSEGVRLVMHRDFPINKVSVLQRPCCGFREMCRYVGTNSDKTHSDWLVTYTSSDVFQQRN
eukprot:2890485-Pyramimonas_sp.AAC.2